MGRWWVLWVAVVLAPWPATAQEDVTCLNTKSGKFARKGTVYRCVVEHFFDDDGKLVEKTYGLAKGVTFSMDFKMDLGLKTIKQVVVDKSFTLPEHWLKARIHLADGPPLPMDLLLAPTLLFEGSTYRVDLRVHDARLGLKAIKSPLVPKGIRKHVLQALNDDATIREKLVKTANKALRPKPKKDKKTKVVE